MDFTVGAVTPAAATESHAVRCVRGAPLRSSMVRAGQTVVDVGLGLEWQQASAPTVLPWVDALDYCKHSSVAGRTDWRLASIKELLTLFSLDKAGAVTFAAGLIDAAGASTQPFFFSSTPGAGEMPTGEAPEMKGWIADIYNGGLEAAPGNGLRGSAIALCVRR